MTRWSVRKVDGRWRVYDHETWSCTFDTLEEAHTEATCNAVADVLYQPGGLTLLAQLKYWDRVSQEVAACLIQKL